ncbi:TPA: hypothetical protein U0616_001444 [Streptococcus suis]|nr:hypothetical protein [Streptococcus suis]
MSDIYNKKYFFEKLIQDNLEIEEFLTNFSSLEFKTQYNIIAEAILNKNKKATQNISTLILESRTFLKNRDLYYVLGEILGIFFIKSNGENIQDDWIFCISDCRNQVILNQVKNTLLSKYGNSSAKLKINETWIDSQIISYRDLKSFENKKIELNTHKKDVNYTKITLGALLNLSAFHHFFDLPVYILNTFRGNSNIEKDFIIIFEKDDDIELVTNGDKTGFTKSVKKCKRVKERELLEYLAFVPIKNIPTVSILEVSFVPENRAIKLKYLYQVYRELSVLKDRFKNIVSTNESFIKSKDDIYDPFRYATSVDFEEERLEKILGIVAKENYLQFKDFHPFLKNKRGNVLNIKCLYRDKRNNKSVEIFLMGWYLSDGKLKIRWRPTYKRKLRWRSSLVSVDIVSGHYFFRGELYKNGQYPVFFKDLTFIDNVSNRYISLIEKEYRNFLNIIEEQKKLALLHKVRLL